MAELRDVWNELPSEDLRSLSVSCFQYTHKKAGRGVRHLFLGCFYKNNVYEEILSAKSSTEESRVFVTDISSDSQPSRLPMKPKKNRGSLTRTVHHPLDSVNVSLGNDEIDKTSKDGSPLPSA